MAELRNEISKIERTLRNALELAQTAHELSYDYPNPYAGKPAPLTSATMFAEQWLKKALSDAIAEDIDSNRAGKPTNVVTNSNVGLVPPFKDSGNQ